VGISERVPGEDCLGGELCSIMFMNEWRLDKPKRYSEVGVTD